MHDAERLAAPVLTRLRRILALARPVDEARRMAVLGQQQVIAVRRHLELARLRVDLLLLALSLALLAVEELQHNVNSR